MDSLRLYLKRLTLDERENYARRAGTTLGYLMKAIYTKPKMGGSLCRRLDEESGGAVPRASLRPDIWPAPPTREGNKCQ